MEILSKNDIYKLKNETLIADYDLETLTNLYEPIIGYGALAIYFTLWGVAKSYGYEVNMTHELLFLKLHMNPGEFISARRKLEAVNLLKTYLKKGQDVNYYTYSLRAPATPKNFFDNVLLAGLLLRAIGEKEMSKLRCIYHLDNYQSEGEDISSTIGEEFNPNFNDPSFKNVINHRDDIVGRIRATANSDFDYDLFLKEIKANSQIRKAAFTQGHLKEINRLAQLYGIDEKVMAGFVIQCFNVGASSENRFDFNKLNRLCQNDNKFPYLKKKADNKTDRTTSSSTTLGKKVNLMETMPPKDFLRLLQEGIPPVSSDLNILNDLSKQLALNNGVINALVEFVLIRNNNVLSRSYTMKVGASLAREKIESAYDAMNFLNKTSNNKTYINSFNEVKEEKVEAQDKNNTSGTKEKTNDENMSWDDMLKELGY